MSVMDTSKRDEARIAELLAKNERLATALRAARDQLATIAQRLEELAQPPGAVGTLVCHHQDGIAEVAVSGRKLLVAVSPDVDLKSVLPGQEVHLNESMVVVGVGGFENVGNIATLKEFLEDDRAVVVGPGDDERVVRFAGSLNDVRLKIGDSLAIDTRTGFAIERVPKSEVEELVLEEIPNVGYDDIGGLSAQIEAIRDAVELPFIHPELFREHALKPPKGVLLYGPPGCGKTLIAKAVARSLAETIAAARGDLSSKGAKSYFLNVKGPELLNKYVGETERHIRLIFARAREKASEGTPVVVFFDEMESLFRTRGTGRSSDVETTIVPQLLAEIDGVERLENVIVIGASNREDMIDPAILRPGRLDVKIKVERPDAEAACEIFRRYLTPDLPIHRDDLAEHAGDRAEAIESMVQTVVGRMYALDEENQFLEVTYASGDKEILYFKDFNSGAMINNVVDRAKKYAIKDFIATGQHGLSVRHLLAACIDEFKENEDLPNTTNPDDWARISGKKGEKIIFIRTIVQSKKSPSGSRTVDTIATSGPYL